MKFTVPNDVIVTTYAQAKEDQRRHVLAGYEAARQLAEEIATRMGDGRIAMLDGPGALRLMIDVMEISAEPVPNMPIVAVDYPNDNSAKLVH